jgi:hypothetical protein
MRAALALLVVAGCGNKSAPPATDTLGIDVPEVAYASARRPGMLVRVSRSEITVDGVGAIALGRSPKTRRIETEAIHLVGQIETPMQMIADAIGAMHTSFDHVALSGVLL